MKDHKSRVQRVVVRLLNAPQRYLSGEVHAECLGEYGSWELVKKS